MTSWGKLMDDWWIISVNCGLKLHARVNSRADIFTRGEYTSYTRVNGGVIGQEEMKGGVWISYLGEWTSMVIGGKELIGKINSRVWYLLWMIIGELHLSVTNSPPALTLRWSFRYKMILYLFIYLFFPEPNRRWESTIEGCRRIILSRRRVWDGHVCWSWGGFGFLCSRPHVGILVSTAKNQWVLQTYSLL